MRFSCRPLDLAYLESAPYRIENQVLVNAAPDRVFKVFEDENSWPQWVDAINQVEWTSPKPFGIGTTRTVTLNGVNAYEQFIAWDPGERFTFYFKATSIPFMRTFCEDYRLHNKIPERRSSLTPLPLSRPSCLNRLAP